MRVIIAIGSNNRQQPHVQWASQRLTTLLSDVRFSRCLWTPDVKGSACYYLNRLATGTTDLPLSDLVALLKQAEALTGRRPGSVTVDLDVLQYGDERHHLHDWTCPYTQQLLPDLL